ncbi:hypothetical protein J2R99_001509 [Rhodopseudomonas julia]|uniref:DUF1223 domain-containing protein n=1 Tax=Rhodopseudomonas julia TaxID=200617 RepID=A0ABU0C586_9BRAD|nr:DUF1223 domain-containing protein [Rhodopseudomonas julia]MDQ0325660.1 hypothetical protein [Rhodopseudomonas julia]
MRRVMHRYFRLLPFALPATLAVMLGVALAMAPAPAQAESAEAATHRSETKAVIELFTSQGCSACPPADAFLNELSSRDDVVILSLPVDYWDYLGWKDTLAQPENTARQRAYAAVRGDGKVYTPQMVVNGHGHYVGSNRHKITSLLATAHLPVSVSLSRTHKRLNVDIGAGTPPQDGMVTVRLVTFLKKAEVPIRSGANHGRTLTYRNVVLDNEPIGMWDGKAMQLVLPTDAVMEGPGRGCAIILQIESDKGPGRILGAGTLRAEAQG